ncbi:FAD-dependent oxidoreductase [Oleiphilus sp. HI0071]|uniref:NAD(P)/FAD-dependent oxidoreductase n=1 Tax=Oleiphilus sp. HI0079 TaxID=1822254 RepID=UPI0007C3DAE4|nr:FAD-dependent oxidoreductase [Oleiphilus sp. HI0079]KZY74518.1 FAD-dependent oxidoreductase [Oleiphilus sp. HI0065]KZY89204.1 FAD-dependent oxidoreductase [Oleiphilus sp. HI0073]KZY90338.1 FAD-dependent oxidoreductase [Oleiphilus sp. HI0071]KZZ51297.1 FAD-dependent oxidoreductase [Oleiphilus sp. HI0122]KZZ52479.1 FAD-dependent oxidoreductase [Oleiphilus sp. HI0118]KZZ81484.1 FAD-dependent oxidoreductase [Oleiphilus sp. HI0133]
MMTEVQSSQKIAVIGSGISGLTTAYLLSRRHEVTVFEANDYLGGHTHTKHIERGGRRFPVNTGFIVYNDWTYPNFIKLMSQLGVQTQESDMSFSVHDENSGLEYNGTSINTLFAQRVNLFRPSFFRMVKDILRFNKETVAALNRGDDLSMTLGDYIEANGYSKGFRDYYIIPMGAAIWSASTDVMMNFPLEFFLRFFNNHGMLSVDDRPTWRVLSDGSSAYVSELIKPFEERIRLNTPVQKVIRSNNKVVLRTKNGDEEFDQVVMACHSDQALKMLAEPTALEHEVLGAIPYQENEVVLHTDERLMPKRKLAWAAWNYHIPQRRSEHAMVTYNMNILQSFEDAPETFLVTLNRSTEIDESKVIERFNYAHPVFTQDGVAAQARHGEISGHNRTHYCGAYWFNGFHEDGVNSALRVAQLFGITL